MEKEAKRLPAETKLFVVEEIDKYRKEASESFAEKWVQKVVSMTILFLAGTLLLFVLYAVLPKLLTTK